MRLMRIKETMKKKLMNRGVIALAILIVLSAVCYGIEMYTYEKTKNEVFDTLQNYLTVEAECIILPEKLINTLDIDNIGKPTDYDYTYYTPDGKLDINKIIREHAETKRDMLAPFFYKDIRVGAEGLIDNKINELQNLIVLQRVKDSYNDKAEITIDEIQSTVKFNSDNTEAKISAYMTVNLGGRTMETDCAVFFTLVKDGDTWYIVHAPYFMDKIYDKTTAEAIPEQTLPPTADQENNGDESNTNNGGAD